MIVAPTNEWNLNDINPGIPTPNLAQIRWKWCKDEQPDMYYTDTTTKCRTLFDGHHYRNGGSNSIWPCFI